ncbi:MAG: hypothetical protein AVDCRST_MAG34-693 [uncultured Nocardioidaceae bacterium]|uniref:J domain-containing protein n=1 Tax=uncultured Nocardioidaceae bacterium TaxID=253824 RepID=A0A6J4LRS0_9ACTN|nr:MAG: hypothetical protein AVDCRST_MAG34-693 [uncultured Nocardioidaceae bacterium]
MDVYAVLGVPRYATVEEIKSAYRERARFLHPDRHVREDGTVPLAVQEAFIRLNHAFRAALARTTVPAAASIPQQRSVPPTMPPTMPSTRPASGPMIGPSGGPPPRRGAGAPVPRVVPVTPMDPSAPSVPAPRGPARRSATDADPMLMLLTLPQGCRPGWPREALEVWALTLVPAARLHLQEARRVAIQAGALASDQRARATAHALLTLTVSGLRAGRRLRMLSGLLPSAYDALESELPPTVVKRLPARVGIGRGGLGSLLG